MAGLSTAVAHCGPGADLINTKLQYGTSRPPAPFAVRGVVRERKIQFQTKIYNYCTILIYCELFPTYSHLCPDPLF